uniref:BTB domain-containing protein n=1 Tax=Panagrolaimus sp. ES5 TaxID=591445 RepID=A0AC34FMK0_9BILA
VHKQVLQQESTVFARMFESQWKESVENRMEIPEFSYKIVKLAIDSLYSMESIKNSIDILPHTVVEYANLAAKYGFVEFQDWCVQYLILCMKCQYSVKNIESLEAKTEKALLQKLFLNPTIFKPFNWKLKGINSVDMEEKMEF